MSQNKRRGRLCYFAICGTSITRKPKPNVCAKSGDNFETTAQLMASRWITDSCAVVRIMLGCEMTKEYLKMADVFRGDVTHICKDLFDGNGNLLDSICLAYAAHAINSHDELVAEVERLRGELSVASSALDEVDRVISERIKNGAYDLDDISSEVSYALEQLNRDAD